MASDKRQASVCAFPEYGGGGDSTGARRTRHSFRLCVFACLAITFMLWFSERYLRYELVESQYIAALTLEPESARAMLRQVVKRDASLHESPTAKYLAALAEREETDLVLPTYENACKTDANNPFTAMRYGCRLFMAEQFMAAQSQFERADSLPPANAWPTYLEAASLPFLKPEAEVVLGESLAIVAKANGSGEPLLVPRPLWTSAMPERGLWYDKLRRHISDEFCAPLYRYTDLVMRQARRAIALRQFQSWDSWLETLQTMGERLLAWSDLTGEHAESGGGSIQATAGIHIQIMTLDERQAIRTQQGAAADPRLDEKRQRLVAGLTQLNAFEDTRDRRIETDRRRFTMPLHACWKTLGILFAAYLAAYVLSWLMRVRRVSWTLPHSRLGVTAFAAGQSFLLLQLGFMAILERYPAPTALVLTVRVVWWAAIAALLAFGLLYPHLRLPAYAATATHWHESLRRRSEIDEAFLEASDAKTGPDASVPESPESDTGTLRAARGARRIAYVAFMRRYYGVMVGLFVCTISVWAIGYRIATALYPWQLEVLVTGMGSEEAQVVHQVITSLSGAVP